MFFAGVTSRLRLSRLLVLVIAAHGEHNLSKNEKSKNGKKKKKKTKNTENTENARDRVAHVFAALRRRPDAEPDRDLRKPVLRSLALARWEGADVLNSRSFDLLPEAPILGHNIGSQTPISIRQASPWALSRIPPTSVCRVANRAGTREMRSKNRIMSKPLYSNFQPLSPAWLARNGL